MSSKIIPGEMILEGSIPDAQLEIPPKKEFTDLDDTPADYTASADKVLVVNGTPDGVEFTDSPTVVELQATGRIYSGTLTITASADDTDVSGINTLFINTTSGDITLGGLVGGVDGQVINIAIIANFTNSLFLEHDENIGGATQDFINHTGLDEEMTGGGSVYVCNGTNWYDVGHAKHV